jgi:lysophospholipase L1-like esterase
MTPVAVVVFLDENANGRLDPFEGGRIPEVEVVIGGQRASTQAGSGRAVVSAPAGAQTVTLTAATLPPYHVAGPGVSVQVPAAGEVPYPVTLPLGPSNNPRVYLAFGDSITLGDGSSDGSGFRAGLEALLRAHFGGAEVVLEGRGGRVTESGVRFIEDAIDRHHPGYALVLLGTNDWNLPGCQDSPPCGVVDNLREVVRRVQGKGAWPILATLIPSNPALSPGRNDWNAAVNAQIKAMAAQEGTVVADLFAAFQGAAASPSLFADHVHPSDAGYDLIARAYFQAIAHGRRG